MSNKNKNINNEVVSRTYYEIVDDVMRGCAEVEELNDGNLEITYYDDGQKYIVPNGAWWYLYQIDGDVYDSDDESNNESNDDSDYG